MSTWSRIYADQIAQAPSLGVFIDRRIGYKKKMVDLIKKYAGLNGRIVEAGCGSGITASVLGLETYEVRGIDADPDMIDLARSIAKKLVSPVTFAVDDIRKLATIENPVDVIFSNGVMEHFSDDEIIAITNLHLSLSGTVIISVPSDYFSDAQKIHGDERFLSREYWQTLMSKTKGRIIEEFDFDSDKPLGNIPQFIGFVLSSS